MGLTVKAPAAHSGPTIEHQEAGLTVFQSNPFGGLAEVCEDRDFLPYIRTPWPIERMKADDGKGGKVDATGLMVIAAGPQVRLVPAPHIMTVLAGRTTTKEKVTKADGKPGNKRTYDGSKNAAMQAEHAKQLARIAAGEKAGNGSDAVSLGWTGIVAVLFGDTCTVGLFDAFKTQAKYWFGSEKHPERLGIAHCGKGKACEFLINDHNVNEVTGKSGGKYYDPRKFTQWRAVDLTPAQKALITGAVNEHKDAINEWLSK